jgi:hypothetical protein
MGNTVAAAPIIDEAVETTVTTPSDSTSQLPWPENLYVETRDMMAVSFLIFSFGYILETARKSPDEFDELDVSSGVIRNHAAAALQRSFTPGEVVELIEKNAEILAETFPSKFRNPEPILQSLKLLQERALEAGIERPLTLEEFDDKHQKHELVYGLAVDRINKRVTLAFRGTENELAFGTNWSTNLSFLKRKVRLPSYFDDKETNTIYLHSGFYQYLFEQTFDDTDDPNKRKYDEILDDVLRLLADHPGYRLYVTGHSLGGALASMVSLFLACDVRLPKPVTCLTAGAPRVGGSGYLPAVQILENHGQLRYCRVVNDKDAVAVMPMVGFHHAGFQIRLYRNASSPMEVSYPKKGDSWAGRWARIWGNSLFTNLNSGYDHGDYRERVEQNKEELAKLDLNDLYANPELTGWAKPKD